MGSVLIVEDDAVAAAAIARAVSRRAVAQTVGSIREALAAMERPQHWLAAIVDCYLPDGEGITLAQKLVAPPLRLPTLVVTGAFDPKLANQAQVLGASFLFKPAELSDIDAFLERAQAGMPDTRLGKALEAFVVQHGLTARERDLVSLVVEGVDRRDLGARLSTKDSTVKSQVRSILKKCGAKDIGEVSRRILETALGRSRA